MNEVFPAMADILSPEEIAEFWQGYADWCDEQDAGQPYLGFFPE